MIREIIFALLIIQIPLWSFIGIWFFNYLRLNIRSVITKKQSYVPLLILICIAILLSFLRAVLIDPNIVIKDGYDNYAGLMTYQLLDWNMYIDEFYRLPGQQVQHWPHKYRIEYSLLVAIINILTSWNVIIIGRIISIISFLASVYLLNLIMINSGHFNNEWNRFAVLSLFITNVTIVTNLVRFETDIFFLALILSTISIYQKYLNSKKLAKLGFALVLSAICFVLVFTREIGAILVGAIFIHQFIILGRKGKVIFLLACIIIITILFSQNLLINLIFYMVWAGSTHAFATELVYNGNLLVFLEYIPLKFTAPNLYIKNMESIFYAFGIPSIYAIVGASYVLKNTTKRKKALSNILTIYFFIFMLVLLILKIGRTLDRFLIPVLCIPYLLVPIGIDKISIKIIEKRGTDENHSVYHAKQLALLVVIQILIYGVRIILALLEISIEF